MSRRGAVIALSGVDCAGKSTQRELLRKTLRSIGCEPVTLWTRPGHTPGLRTLKAVLRALTGRKRRRRSGVSAVPGLYPRRASNLGHPLKRRLWLSAALLDLLWVYGVRIRWHRALGRTVVCDRYLLDCLVDFRVHFPGERVEHRWLGRLLRRVAVRPDTSFCMLVPAEVTMERARGKARFHWETREDLENRRQQYETLSRELGALVLDGLRPTDEIARSIQRRVADILPRAALSPSRLQ